ncbi:MAG: signal peptidase I [Anaerolineaceae bacterium]|nr:signal peptidase I [Anaerolineaceae bacterium]
MVSYLVFGLFGFGLVIINTIALWKINEKAGQPGIAALIPIYNTYVILEIVGRPAWWLLLTFIPGLNIIISIIIAIDLAASFGKGSGFGLGLIFLGFIFILILAFGDAQYIGPSATKP